MHIFLCTLLNFGVSVLKRARMALELKQQETKETTHLWNVTCLVAEAVGSHRNDKWEQAVKVLSPGKSDGVMCPFVFSFYKRKKIKGACA